MPIIHCKQGLLPATAVMLQGLSTQCQSWIVLTMVVLSFKNCHSACASVLKACVFPPQSSSTQLIG